MTDAEIEALLVQQIEDHENAANLIVSDWSLPVVEAAIRRYEEDGDLMFGHVTGTQARKWIRLFVDLGWTPPGDDDVL